MFTNRTPSIDIIFAGETKFNSNVFFDELGTSFTKIPSVKLSKDEVLYEFEESTERHLLL